MDTHGVNSQPPRVWWWWPNANDHVHSFAPIWISAQLFGVHTISHDQANYKPSMWELLSAFGLTALRIYLIHATLTTDSWDLLFKSSSVIVEQGLDILLKLPLLLMLISPWLQLLRKPIILTISHDLKVFDEMIESYSYPQSFQFYHAITTMISVVCIANPLIILAWIRGFSFWIQHFFVITFVAASWTGGLLFNSFFNVLILHIVGRLESINDILNNILHNETIGSDAPKPLNLIKALMRLHDKLSDISSNCSSCFCYTVYCEYIVLMMLHVMAAQILAVFAVIRVIFYHYDETEFKDCVLYLIGTSFYCILPLIAIWFAADLKKRTIITWKLVHRIINTTNSAEVEDLLQQFSEQMSHRTANVDFRFVDGDWSLLVKACSEVATYLIIMMQFERKQ
uniref:Gustatory receptor n=1 Tax=Anopheles dirus TaxID=7168 RepID=A0A182NR13_9DIPT